MDARQALQWLNYIPSSPLEVLQHFHRFVFIVCVWVPCLHVYFMHHLPASLPEEPEENAGFPGTGDLTVVSRL